MARLIIFANGILPEIESAQRLLQPGDVILAADGGMRHIRLLGLTPSQVIGDLDSLAADERHQLEAAGVKVQQYPRDKDKTDLELALDFALREGYQEIRVVGALGGRLDQTAGNLALLTNPGFADLDIRIDDGVEEAFMAQRGCKVHGRAGDILSLLPWGGRVDGIITEGLRWPLENESLFPDQTRGISNEMMGETVSISFRSGILLVIHRRQG